jgi:hypothetical protein
MAGAGCGPGAPRHPSPRPETDRVPRSLTRPSLRTFPEDTRNTAGMQPLHLARIEDLRHGDLVRVDCAACHHVALLTPDFLLRLGLDPRVKVLDLTGRVRCRRCGARGRACVSAAGRDPTHKPDQVSHSACLFALMAGPRSAPIGSSRPTYRRSVSLQGPDLLRCYEAHRGKTVSIRAAPGIGIAPEQRTRASSPSGTESLRTLRWREMDSNY